MNRLDAFPDAKIYHSGLKFPTTRNGKEILAEEYKARIELCEGFDFPSLEKYSDTVKFFRIQPIPRLSGYALHDRQ